MATFTNQATLTYNGQTTTSNVTVGELTDMNQLFICRIFISPA